MGNMIQKQFEMILYSTDSEDVTVNAVIKDESIWLSQKGMADLFGIDKSGISRHLTNIFKSGELSEEVVVAKIATTTQDSVTENFSATPRKIRAVQRGGRGATIRNFLIVQSEGGRV